MQLSNCDLKDQRGSCVLCLSILNWPWILRHWFFIFYQGQALSPFWPQPAVWASGPRSPVRMRHICWFFFTADSVQVAALAGSRRPQATHSGALGTFRGWASCVQNDNDPPCLQTLALTLVQTPARGSGQTHVLQPCPQHFVHPQCSQPLYHPWQGKGHRRSCWGDENVLKLIDGEGYTTGWVHEKSWNCAIEIGEFYHV